MVNKIFLSFLRNIFWRSKKKIVNFLVIYFKLNLYFRIICNYVYCKRCRVLVFLLICLKFIFINGINIYIDVVLCLFGEENDEGRNLFWNIESYDIEYVKFLILL